MFCVCVCAQLTEFINHRLIELHNKTIIVFGGFFITVAGWWLWNLALAGVYQASIGPYIVRGSFIRGFGRTAVWWLSVIGALAAVVVLELVIKSIRRIYFPTDTIIMQELEQKQRKKEAAAAAAEKRGQRGGGGGGGDEIEGQELEGRSQRHDFGASGKPSR